MTDQPPYGPPPQPYGAPPPQQPYGAPPPQQPYGAPPPGYYAPAHRQDPYAPGTPGHERLATWGSRVGAALIDGLIVGLPVAILLAVFGIGIASSDEGDSGFVAFVIGAILTVILLVVALLVYAPLLMMRPGERNGQTIGKQMVGIRVVRDNGVPFDFWYAALREAVVKGLAVGFASSFIPVLPYFLNYLWPLWDDSNRAVHDIVVDTHVVRA
jgi:uncharacterized RDD family membrane protein YckC